jgi:NAD(P)-dependent dehydrogenase (short-subunit alcohol dehydrogenase family)
MSARVLITGAAGGIGAASCELLRRRGAQIAGLDLEARAPDILRCDVRNQDSVDAAVREAEERLGGIDVLINNAGIGLPQSAAQRPGPDALAVIDVNLLGAWRVTGAAYSALRAASGRVVNVASGLAFLAVPFAPAYCASKRAMVAYSDALRFEVAPEVSVTTVYPGYVKTPIHDASAQQGFSLEGLVPEETLTRAAETLAKAALGPWRRDLATTRLGTLNYALARRAPRRVMDALIMAQIRHQARTGRYDDSPLAGQFARRLGKARNRDE